jgi:hypothetical protein
MRCDQRMRGRSRFCGRAIRAFPLTVAISGHALRKRACPENEHRPLVKLDAGVRRFKRHRNGGS